MDGTLIKPKDGRRFPTDSNDWEFWGPEVIPKLKALHKDGFVIAVFTNQGGVAIGKTNPADLKIKFRNIQKEVTVPMSFFVAIGRSSDKRNAYRKPRKGMFWLCKEDVYGFKKVDTAESFYCGDAAGRMSDFADSDIKFAVNIGLNFLTPEMFF